MASSMELFTYLDPQNIEQGPFALCQLNSWCAAGQMPTTTRVRLFSKPFETYRVLSEVANQQKQLMHRQLLQQHAAATAEKAAKRAAHKAAKEACKAARRLEQEEAATLAVSAGQTPAAVAAAQQLHADALSQGGAILCNGPAPPTAVKQKTRKKKWELKPQLCPHFEAHRLCPAGEDCEFAHTHDKLRMPSAPAGQLAGGIPSGGPRATSWGPRR